MNRLSTNDALEGEKILRRECREEWRKIVYDTANHRIQES